MKLRMFWLELLVFGLAAGCDAAGGDVSSAQPTSPEGSPNSSPMDSPVDAQRVIAEADIIQLDAGLLYALSKSGTLSVVDVSTPAELTLLGQTTVHGVPFEMYLRDGLMLAMANGAVDADGEPQPLAATGQPTALGSGAAVFVLDVQDPSRIDTLATFPVAGEIADSRIVGNVLYLATYENAKCYHCGSRSRTLVTSFDISEPTDMRQVDQVSFEDDAPDVYNLAWGTRWKRSIFVTEQRLYVGGHGDIDPQNFGAADEGIIDVLDVSDAEGRLGVGAHIKVPGAIVSRWQLDERDGILRVVSQKGVGRSSSGIGAPQVDTFRVDSARSITPLGHMTMRLPRQEGLRSVRFDESRAYAITYYQTDPLFVIDLSDPEHPEQRGELHIPGYMFHLEPHGDRVIGLGFDNTDTQGSLNVSLLDVSHIDQPRMLKRVAFGTPAMNSEYATSVLSADQDRIQKAFRVLPDGLVVVPFTVLRGYGAQPFSCQNIGGGVQLVEWRGDTLHRRALLPLPGNPLRGLEYEDEMIVVSDSTVRTFSLADLDIAHETDGVTIGDCLPWNAGYAFSGVPSAGGISVRTPARQQPLMAAARGGHGCWSL